MSTFEKRLTHIWDVRGGVDSFLSSGKSIDPGMDTDFWTYHTNGEMDYVGALAALPAELFVDLYDRYAVRADEICFRKALLPARFQWCTRKGVEYWEMSLRFERRVLSALESFVPGHF